MADKLTARVTTIQNGATLWAGLGCPRHFGNHHIQNPQQSDFGNQQHHLYICGQGHCRQRRGNWREKHNLWRRADGHQHWTDILVRRRDTISCSASPATETGNFSKVTILPAIGLVGVFDPTTGILTISGNLIPTTPTNLFVSVNGGQINLSWPASYLGWSLQVQTNSLSVGLSTNWFTIPGSSLVTSTNYPFLNGETAFFRMFYQP